MSIYHHPEPSVHSRANDLNSHRQSFTASPCKATIHSFISPSSSPTSQHTAHVHSIRRTIDAQRHVRVGKANESLLYCGFHEKKMYKHRKKKSTCAVLWYKYRECECKNKQTNKTRRESKSGKVKAKVTSRTKERKKERADEQTNKQTNKKYMYKERKERQRGVGAREEGGSFWGD